MRRDDNVEVRWGTERGETIGPKFLLRQVASTERFNKSFQKKIAGLCVRASDGMEYVGYRKIHGNGNNYYRTVVFPPGKYYRNRKA